MADDRVFAKCAWRLKERLTQEHEACPKTEHGGCKAQILVHRKRGESGAWRHWLRDAEISAVWNFLDFDALRLHHHQPCRR
jgi:hypothetical protein